MNTSCPECQSNSLRWRVRRVVGRTLLHSARELVWSCRACGAEWSDAIQPSTGLSTADASESTAPPPASMR